ncbi:MAG: type II toxin-antitoxin system RelE/ParE family toxin [Myxococcales bacterium]|nr:type II toxin-antitoxin system RelE/ParE family toxin [Myxococcales bacterium]
MPEETKSVLAVGAGVLIGVLISFAGLFYGLRVFADIPSGTALVLSAIPSALVLAAGGAALLRGSGGAVRTRISSVWKGLPFWLGLAPVVVFAGWRLVGALALSGLSLLGLREPIPPILLWGIHACGALAGFGLLVLVRHQVASYAEQDAAILAPEPDGELASPVPGTAPSTLALGGREKLALAGWCRPCTLTAIARGERRRLRATPLYSPPGCMDAVNALWGGRDASFGDRGTEDLYHGRRTTRVRRFPADVLGAALRKLDLLNAAHALLDLGSPPGNRLEILRGDWAGFHSIRVNDQWRLVFRWSGNQAHDVQLVDYHNG